MPPVRLAESDMEGKGVFAAEPVESGDTVLVLDTSRLVTEEEPLRPEEGETRVVARRRIEAGEEVTLDYLINTDGGSSWDCDCGADRCRGTLETSFFELPEAFQREYLPLLEDWFVEDHRERVERLRRRLGGGGEGRSP